MAISLFYIDPRQIETLRLRHCLYIKRLFTFHRPGSRLSSLRQHREIGQNGIELLSE